MSAAVFLLSAALLAHELLLLRVLALAYWHHAASLVVSVALLGFGAAGTLLALVPRAKRPTTVAFCAGLYALAIPLSLRAAARVDFNVLEVGWDPTQWLRLLALEGIFLVPFLIGAFGIAVALALKAERPGGTYAANLAGSGAGALLAPMLAFLGPPVAGLQVAAILAGFAAAPAPVHNRWKLWGIVGAFASFFLSGSGLPMSPFKDLPAEPEKRILATEWGPHGRVDVAEVPSLHYAPGLSMFAPALPPARIALYVDGHRVAVREHGSPEYLDHTVGALPFVLLGDPETVQLGVGPELARATRVVETDPNLLAAAQVPGVAREPRAWLEETADHCGLIVHHLPSLHAAAETPLLTFQGIRRAFDRADAVALSCGLATPPRAGLKLLATAERVTDHVVAVRTADRLCVVLLHRATTDADRAKVMAFCDENGFDPVRPLAWRYEEPHHVTSTPLLPAGADYPYDVRPATDARPYFFKYFRWSRLGDLLDREKTPFVQWPFVALLVAFAQVTCLAVLLMAGPLVLSHAARAPALLFLALGAGFMLLEMAFLQRAMVRVGSPVLGAAAVIGGFLVGSGCGSLAGERLGRPLRAAAFAVVVLAPIGFWLLPRAPVAAALVCGVVAFPMGMPFPSALSRLASCSVPWALAWNGSASVAAAAAAPLLSSTWGIPITGLGGLACYALIARASGV